MMPVWNWNWGHFGPPIVVNESFTVGTPTAGTPEPEAKVFLANASGGAFTITLPDASVAPNKYRPIFITKTDSSANAVTVAPHSGQKVGNASSRVLRVQGECLLINSNGVDDWPILAHYPGAQGPFSGSSFPSASDWSGKAFLNTTLNRWGYSDGTNWLSEEFPILMAQYTSAPPFNSTTEFLAWAPPQDYAIKITRFSFSFYLGGNADSSNYWKARLRTLEGDAGTVLTLGDIQTPNGTGGGWTKTTDLTSFSNNPMEVDDIWLQLYLEKTGAPPDIQQLAIGVWGRRVYA